MAQIYARCIGCRFCMAACPYNAKYFNWYTYQKERQAKTRMFHCAQKASVEKCTFCHHRLQKARERALAEKREFDPENISRLRRSLSRQAIVFGDLADPASEVAKLARSPRAFKLQEELGTKPKVIYLAEGEGGG